MTDLRIFAHAAALKCRQRKKAWLAQLQAKVEFLQNENESLSQALMAAREEITRLSALVGTGAAGTVGTVTVIPGVPGVNVNGVAVNGQVNGVTLGQSSGHAQAQHAPPPQPTSHANHANSPHNIQPRPSQSPSGPGAPGSVAPVAVNVSLASTGKSLPAPAPTAGMVGAGGGRGYGY